MNRLSIRKSRYTLSTVFSLGVILYCANHVRADCGDYLNLPSHPGAIDLPGPMQSDPKPCTGPNCSQRPPDPIPIPFPVRLANLQSYAIAEIKDVGGDPPTERFHPADSSKSSIQRSVTIFHPPRVESSVVA